MALVGFARVSTREQDLEIQLEALNNIGCDKIFHGKQSGVSEQNATKLAELVEYVRAGDIVVTTKLDRIGRSLKAILEVLQQLRDKDVQFKTLDNAIDTTNESPFAQAQIAMIGTFAQLERDLIAQRTGEGREAAKANGVKFGRKSILSDDKKQEIKGKLKKGATVYRLAIDYDVSRQTIMRVRGN
jgi:DNA invertase Pin-like site-specific DNA recombinase